MAANNFENFSVAELQKEKTKTKKYLGAGIGAYLALVLILLVAIFLNIRQSGEIKLWGLPSALLLFGLALFPYYRKLQNIEAELEKKTRR